MSLRNHSQSYDPNKKDLSQLLHKKQIE